MMEENKNSISFTEKLAESLKFKTISLLEPSDEELKSKHAALLGLHKYLEDQFPLVHKHGKKEIVNGYSLVFQFKGKDINKLPYLLMSHMDVVNVEHLEKWEHDPFSGDIDDNFVWGRGSMDDKCGGILHGVECALSKGMEFNRGFYLAFGHDEEIGGHEGARVIAELFKNRKINFEFVFDEGSATVTNAVPYIDKPVALVGIAQKGACDIEIQVESPPEQGHAMFGSTRNPIIELNEILLKLTSKPPPPRMTEATYSMFSTLGPLMTFAPFRLLFSNLWLTEKLLLWIISKNPITAPTVSSIPTLTFISAGEEQSKVAPHSARAIIRYKTLPGDNEETIIDYIKKTIGEKENVRIKPAKVGISAPSSNTSSQETFGYKAICEAAKQTYPEQLVAPFLQIGGSDSIHYQSITENTYRYMPIVIDKADFSRIHGVNERLSLKSTNYLSRYFLKLIELIEEYDLKAKEGSGKYKHE